MCKWGTEVPLEVTIPAHLSHTGEARQKVVGVDACLAPTVRALNAGGVPTVASCCGHGHLPATIAVEGDQWWVRMTRAEMEAFTGSFGVNIHGEPPPADAGAGSEVARRPRRPACVCGHSWSQHRRGPCGGYPGDGTCACAAYESVIAEPIPGGGER